MMTTYQQIVDYIRSADGFVAQSCWIAHVKSDHGLTTRIAPNRKSSTDREKPCPDDYRRDAIERALRHFKMI